MIIFNYLIQNEKLKQKLWKNLKDRTIFSSRAGTAKSKIIFNNLILIHGQNCGYSWVQLAFFQKIEVEIACTPFYVRPER